MMVQASIEAKLRTEVAPAHLEIINESGQHNVPPGSESHFKVVVVSECFEGKSLVAQHRMVYDALGEELRGTVHALAVHTYTPTQWAKVNGPPASPQCLGGKASEG